MLEVKQTIMKGGFVQNRSKNRGNRRRIQHPTVMVGIVPYRGKVLIVKRTKPNGRNLTWVFPGGKKQGRETQMATVVREVREETGCEVKPLVKISKREHPDCDVVVSYFLCRMEGLPNRLAPLAKDTGEVRWAKPTDLSRFFTTDIDPRVADVLATLC